jgi:Bacterial protein of unknown function (DUF922)
MSSALFGADYKLRWADFQSVAAPPPTPQPPAYPPAAFTHPEIKVQGRQLDVVWQGAPGPFYMIRNSLVVRVSLNADSWRLDSVSTWPGPDQVWLLKHEQGHYDIYALLARDYYQRVRSMMGQPFTKPADAGEQLSDHVDATLSRVEAMNRDYDATTWGGSKREVQWSWWCAIERARQLHRSPPARDADGRLLKVELVDALRSFGLGYIDSLQ